MITTHSARVAIHQATAHGWEAREAGAGAVPASSAPRVAHSIACGAVLAAVERCPMPVRDWLFTAYAAESYPGLASTARRARANLYAAYTYRRVVRSPERMFRLAGAVLTDARQCLYSRVPMDALWYARQVGFRSSHWPHWQKAMTAMLAVINDWEWIGLAEVGALLHRELA